jgi:hypothetical protein
MTSRTSPNLSPAAYGAAIARRDQTGFVKKYGIPVHKIEGYCNNSAVQPRNLNRLQIINEDALQHYPAPRSGRPNRIVTTAYGPEICKWWAQIT